MVKFLHIADVHLGTNQYNSPDNTRKKDFFYSFKDVIERYALNNNIDFILIAGDLFDKNKIDPNTLNQSIYVFNLLKEQNIPVFVIEGNHDSQHSRDSISWLQFLGENNYIKFLKPAFKENKISFENNSSNNSTYSYYEFNDQIRIIGTQWFGANTANIIPEISEAIKNLGNYPYTILMMHAGIEGYLAGYGTITKSSLEPLRPYVDYIALGHIHKHYIYDDWAFNPGSLEASCFPEYFDTHGALIVEIDDNLKTTYKIEENYHKREFISINIDISGISTATEAFEEIERRILSTSKYKEDKPLIELVIDGTLEFRRSDLDTDALKNLTKEHLDALIVMLKYYARPKEYAIGVDLSSKNNRKTIEKTVIKDMLTTLNTYKKESDKYADVVINLKDMVLEEETNENILNFLTKSLLKK